MTPEQQIKEIKAPCHECAYWQGKCFASQRRWSRCVDSANYCEFRISKEALDKRESCIKNATLQPVAEALEQWACQYNLWRNGIGHYPSFAGVVEAMKNAGMI